MLRQMGITLVLRNAICKTVDSEEIVSYYFPEADMVFEWWKKALPLAASELK